MFLIPSRSGAVREASRCPTVDASGDIACDHHQPSTLAVVRATVTVHPPATPTHADVPRYCAGDSCVYVPCNKSEAMVAISGSPQGFGIQLNVNYGGWTPRGFTDWTHSLHGQQRHM